MINRNIEYEIPDIMIPLYKSKVRHNIEYGNVVWSPYTKKNINLIESIQRHYTKKIFGLKSLSYEERLKALKLPSLTYRRMRGDLIETYKILHQIYDPITTKNLFTKIPDTSITRKHNSLNLTKFRANKNP